MPTLSELGLTEDQPQNVDYANIPEQYGAYPDPPYPGPYIFKIPSNVSHLWDKFMSKDKDGNEKGERVKINFDRDDPLTIVHALSEAGKPFEGQAVQATIDNNPRARGKEKIPFSDMSYLLVALESSERPQKNAEFIKAVNAIAPGKSFKADIEWRTSCQKGKPSYAIGEDGKAVKRTTKDPNTGAEKEVEGCGAVYYMGDWPKDANGHYPNRIACASCGAALRAFTQLRSFDKAPNY